MWRAGLQEETHFPCDSQEHFRDVFLAEMNPPPQKKRDRCEPRLGTNLWGARGGGEAWAEWALAGRRPPESQCSALS